MMNRKILAMVGVSAMMIGFVACGSKAESSIAESATPNHHKQPRPRSRQRNPQKVMILIRL